MGGPSQDVLRVVCELMPNLSSLCHLLAPAPRLTTVLEASISLRRMTRNT